MRAAFELGGETIKPGSSRVINLPLPQLHSDTEVYMPVHVIHGRRDGPVLFLSAAVHGDEINGVEIIRRILSMSSVKRLRGTLLAIPVVNVFGFNAHTRYLPDRRDLNRCFPGKEAGSMAARLAHIFLSEIVIRSDIGIDLHTAAIHRDNFPQIRADMKDPQLNVLAKAFGAPVILHSAPPDGALRHAAAEESIPVMVYEAGEALRFDEVSIRVGVSGVVNVMREMGMIAKSKSKKRKPSALLRSSAWMRASKSGILRATARLGDMVDEGDALGYISDPAGYTDEVVEATTSGIIIGRTNIPLVYEGEALFHVGRTRQTELLEKHLDTLSHEEELAVPELIEEPVIV